MSQNEILNINYSDSQNDLIDKLNKNFDEIIELHGGLQGIDGPTGSIGRSGEIGIRGEIGKNGVRGARWVISSTSPIGGTGDNIIIGDYWINSVDDKISVFTDNGWVYTGYDFGTTGGVFRLLDSDSSYRLKLDAFGSGFITGGRSIVLNTDSPQNNSFILSDLDPKTENTNPKLSKFSIYSDPKNKTPLISFSRSDYSYINSPSFSWSGYGDNSDDSMDIYSPEGSFYLGSSKGVNLTYRVGKKFKISSDSPYSYKYIDSIDAYEYKFNCTYLDYGFGVSGGFNGFDSKAGFSIDSKNIQFYSSNIEISSYGINDSLFGSEASANYVDTQIISDQGSFKIPKPQAYPYDPELYIDSFISNYFYNSVGVWVKRGLNMSPTSYAHIPSLKIVNNKNEFKKKGTGAPSYWISEKFPNSLFNSALIIARIGNEISSTLLDDVYYINLKSGTGLSGESQFYLNANGKLRTGKIYSPYTIPKRETYQFPYKSGSITAPIFPNDPINTGDVRWFFLTQPFTDKSHKNPAIITVNGNIVVISPPSDSDYIGIGFDSSIFGFFSGDSKFFTWTGSVSFTVYCAPEIYPSVTNPSTGNPDSPAPSLPGTGFRCIGYGTGGIGSAGGNFSPGGSSDIVRQVTLPFKAPAIDFTLYSSFQNGNNNIDVYWRAYEPFVIYKYPGVGPVGVDGVYTKDSTTSIAGGTAGFFTVTKTI